MNTLPRRLLALSFLATFASAAPGALAASPTPEMQTSVRASTFEVVVPKAKVEHLSYEKPLPLELIPYVIRTDAYWSIGTAFAIGPNTYVSAGHVLLAAVGSQFGPPALRDAAGHVYPIDRVLGFSGHEDFIIFSVSGAPPAVPLPTVAEHKIDSVVFAVGNALGEGVVIRDGLLTSETPEPQDGRWKFLRFSAAASPGNSGGPLLDADGRVIGIVLAKSPNENLNYALPIDRAVSMRGKPGTLDVRYSIRLPNVRDADVTTLKAEFSLPAGFADFARDYLAVKKRTAVADQERLLKAHADKIFPKGKSEKQLATVYESLVPSFVQEQQNDSWDATSADGLQTLDLPPRGLVATAGDLGVTVFRLRRPAGASSDGFYSDSRESMDVILKGLKLSRPVGPQQIRITSLGAAESDSVYTDHFGRRWQVRTWPLGYADAHIVSFQLPSPEGYLGFVRQTSSANVDDAVVSMRLLADFFYASYTGTLPQWTAFLKRRDLRPAVFEQIRLESALGQGVLFGSPRLTLRIPKEVLPVDDQSTLILLMSYFMDGGKLAWDVGGVRVWKEEAQKSYVMAERHTKPAADSDRHLEELWSKISTRGPGYNGVAGHDAEFKSYWIMDVASGPAKSATATDADAAVLYVIGYGTEASRYPRDMEESLALIRGGLRVLER
jgi:serine protease Do